MIDFEQISRDILASFTHQTITLKSPQGKTYNIKAFPSQAPASLNFKSRKGSASHTFKAYTRLYQLSGDSIPEKVTTDWSVITSGEHWEIADITSDVGTLTLYLSHAQTNENKVNFWESADD